MGISIKRFEEIAQSQGMSLKEAFEATRFTNKNYNRLKYQEDFLGIAYELIQLAKRLIPIIHYYDYSEKSKLTNYPNDCPFEYREFYLSNYCFKLRTNKLYDRENLEIIDLKNLDDSGRHEFITVFEVVIEEDSTEILTQKNLSGKQLREFKQKLEKLLLINEL